MNSAASQSSSAGLRRRPTVAAEVEDAGHDGLVEVAQPDVIHGDAGRQRVVAVGDPVGQRQPAAGAGLRECRRRPRRVGRGLGLLGVGLRLVQPAGPARRGWPAGCGAGSGARRGRPPAVARAASPWPPFPTPANPFCRLPPDPRRAAAPAAPPVARPPPLRPPVPEPRHSRRHRPPPAATPPAAGRPAVGATARRSPSPRAASRACFAWAAASAASACKSWITNGRRSGANAAAGRSTGATGPNVPPSASGTPGGSAADLSGLRSSPRTNRYVGTAASAS